MTHGSVDSFEAVIRSISATPFGLKYASTVSLSDGVRKNAEQVLVSVTTSDGVTGYGECIPRPGIYGETLEGAVSIIERTLGPRLIGLPISASERIAAAMGFLVGNPAAKSSVEIAVFDAFARTLGLPAHRLLGGYADTVPCCAILAYAETDAVIAEATSAHRADGVEMFKLKVGADPKRDAVTACRLRDALGNDVVIYADANGRYTPQQAARFLREADDAQLSGLEEPLAANDLVGRHRLTADSATPIIGDETCADSLSTTVEVSAGRASAVSIKVARTGILASRRIREYCGSLGLPLVIGSQADSALGAYTAAAFAASSSLTAAAPAEVLFYRAFANNPVQELPLIGDGRMQLSERPGFGYEIDPSFMKEATIQ